MENYTGLKVIFLFLIYENPRMWINSNNPVHD
jgi:hypothetical protein